MTEVVPGLSGLEARRLASCVAIAMVLFTSALVSSSYERGFGRRPLFALILGLLGWCTLTLGAALSGVPRLWPPILALAPLLSGYLGPAIFAYTRELTEPQRAASPSWFLLGLLGTTYSILALTMEGGLDWARQSMVHSNPYWHPLFSPLMLLHSFQLVLLTLVSAFLLTRAYLSGTQPSRRRSQSRMLLVCWCGLLILLFTNILPSFRIVVARIEPAFLTLPFAIVGILVVRGFGEDLVSMRESREEARELRMESLGTMARGLAHDLNNVLTSIVGHAELARLDVASESNANRHLDEVIQGSQRAAALMERMLSFSGRRARPIKVISSRSSLEAAYQAMSSLQSAEQPMKLRLEDNLPHVRIDAAELESALINLLENALQALGSSAGVVTVRAVRDRSVQLPHGAIGPLPSGVEALRVEVEDDGEGMVEEVAGRALEPFFTTRPRGKGLGLVNVMSNVVGADGALWFTSEPGRGTRFVFWLPACSPPGVSSEPSPVCDIGGRCLLVEDDPMVATVGRELLENLGMEVHTYSSAEEALEELATMPSQDPCLAVIDIRLPKMDGIELTTRLLAGSFVNRVLLLSADEPGPRLKCFEGQPVLFRRKPLSLDGLRRALVELRQKVPDEVVFESSG